VNDLREPITVAAELAGHAKVETTMKYIHVLPDHAKRAMDRFSLYGN
jgi:integrase